MEITWHTLCYTYIDKKAIARGFKAKPRVWKFFSYYFIFIYLFFRKKTNYRRKEWRQEEIEAQYEKELAEREAQRQEYPTAEEIETLNNEFAKDARAKMFWIYKTKDMKELKVVAAVLTYIVGLKIRKKCNFREVALFDRG